MKLSKYFNGQMAVVFTLILATMMGVMALGTDIGVMYYQWVQLQKGADAAAVAGANFLNGGIAPATGSINSSCTGEPDDAQRAACSYVLNNGLASDASSMTLNEPAVGLPATAPTPNLQVIVKKNYQPYYFGKLIGLSTYNVTAMATAKANQNVTASGSVFPIGLECASPCSLSELVPGSSAPFNVKFSPAIGGAPGNWQWVNIGNGASDLGAAVTNGIDGTLMVGGTISTATGNKGNSGPVKSAFDARMRSCPSISDPCTGSQTAINDIPAGDPCLVTVPAVDFAGCTGSCGNLTIEGFAQVYIEPTSSSGNTGQNGTKISACYINAVDSTSIVGGSTGASLGAIAPPNLIQ
ncbi:MAG: hypothetical protein IVW56_00335 [Candidatus Binataceae bacterium]|nr:hypothetical protein [Candidatus Binataceae bacterium]